jgi:hypothetical protein
METEDNTVFPEFSTQTRPTERLVGSDPSPANVAEIGENWDFSNIHQNFVNCANERGYNFNAIFNSVINNHDYLDVTVTPGEEHPWNLRVQVPTRTRSMLTIITNHHKFQGAQRDDTLLSIEDASLDLIPLLEQILKRGTKLTKFDMLCYWSLTTNGYR